ncbi:methyl farnesoate epoxidase-like isoform X1 [Daphnia pulex]|uniref:methyl farnesoate epoxidase-like isoform X1 n=2 Tax=Daphnia pulex TaxID=6669 RepID=UPI001EDEB4B4|nr:methyl farnesoate epoxidase-like isoform X1 [Daphnia pulex]
MSILLILFYVLLAIFCFIKLTLRPHNFPPGPRGMPLLGFAPFFPTNKPFFSTLQKMAKKYGPVIGFYLGPTQPFISVDGKQAAKEALLNNDLNGRPSGTVIISRSFGEKLGLVMVDGDFWQEQRRFTLRHFRDLGFGKTYIENQMMDEISDLILDITEAAKSDPDHVVDFKAIFTVSVFNILWVIIGGKRFQRDNLEFKKLLNNLAQFLKCGNIRALLPIPAFLIRLFPSLPGKLGINGDLCIPVQQFIEKSIDEHIATRSKGDAPRDFIDAYLDEMEEPSEKDSTFTKKQLIILVQDLFTAGSDTSSATIGYTVLYMINYPAIQQKMREEIKNVCGDSLPSLAHRASLPFTEAFVMEVLRMSNVVALGVPHLAMNETQLLGFTIPKGSIVSINLNSVLRDAEMWQDPENFRPERHLDADGKLFRNEAFVPFGMGKRICMCESLARNTVFLFTAALAKTFEFKSLPNKPSPTLEPIVGLVSSPQPFKAVVVPLVH